MRFTSLVWAAIVLVTLMAGNTAHAGDRDAQAPDPASTLPAPEPWLLGDWNGARTRLREGGIDFQFGYTGEFAYNAAGGSENVAAYTDQYAAGVTFDLDRLIGLPNANSRRRSRSAAAAT